MKAKFGVDISKLNTPSSVWMDDASYKIPLEPFTFYPLLETDKITKILSDTGKTFQTINE